MSVAKLDISQWQSFTQNLKLKMDKINPILTAAFSVFGFSDVINHFDTESGPNGKWQKRKQSTQMAYAKILAGTRKPPKGMPRSSFNPSNKLLQLTGHLRKSLLVSNIKQKGKGAIEFYANATYSGVHDNGNPSKNIPQRAFMWLSPTAKERMASYIISELEKA